jgi:hypothetical protein
LYWCAIVCNCHPRSELPPRPRHNSPHKPNEAVSAFIQQSRKRDKELPASQKTLLKVEAGAQLIQPGASDTTLKAGESFKAWGNDAGHAPWVRVKRGITEEVQLGAHMQPYDQKTKTYKDGSLFLAKLADDKRRVWRPQGIVWIERGHLSQEGRHDRRAGRPTGLESVPVAAWRRIGENGVYPGVGSQEAAFLPDR